jgi:hypothetical protein
MSSSQKIVDSNDELMISQDFGYQSSNNIVSSLDTVTHSSAALIVSYLSFHFPALEL